MSSATVAVITHSRPRGLERLLRSLFEQVVTANHEIHLLVVDNACDPEVQALVSDLSRESPFELQYAQESERGIVAARNTSVQLFLESGDQYLAFIDDDSWPAGRDWIQLLLDKREEIGTEIVAGTVIPISGEGAPKWANHIIHDFGSGMEGDRIGAFYTSNVLISRAVLEKLQPAFDHRFALTGGSDYHFSLKCGRAGFSAAFVDAPVEEEFPCSRAKVKWFVLRGYRSGNAYTRAHIFEEQMSVALLRSLVMALVRFARGLGFLVSGALTLSKARLVNGLFRIASGVGTLAGVFGGVHREYAVIHGD